KMLLNRISSENRVYCTSDHGMMDLFDTHASPSGFRYIQNVLSHTEELDFVRRFEKLPLQPFQFRGYRANRRIYTFGRNYVFAGQQPRDDATVPSYFRALMEIASQISGNPPE